MAANFTNAGVFLIQTFFGLYFILIMIRFLMQVSRVDYYNPLCQGIVKITDPPIRPLKQFLPSPRGIDFATLLVGLIVQLISVSLVMLIHGYGFHPVYIGWSLVGMFATVLNIYFFALLIMVIASWIAPMSNHPALSLVIELTEPICAPARRLLPPMGGIDFSIILVFVVITLLDTYLVIPQLKYLLGIPKGVILGL